MELEPGEVEDEDGDHLITGTDLRMLASDIKDFSSQLLHDETINGSLKQYNVQLSLDRFAEIIQIAMTTGNLLSNKGTVEKLLVVKAISNCIKNVIVSTHGMN